MPKGMITIGTFHLVFNNRRAVRYLKDTIDFIRTDESIVVKVADDINKSIARIKKLCEYISAELVYSGRVSEAVTNYALEEEKYSEFAEKAQLIRDNHCNKDDFEKSTGAVYGEISDCCPSTVATFK